MSAKGIKAKKTSGYDSNPKPMSFKKALQRYWVLYIILFVIMAYYCLFHYYTIYLGVMMAFKDADRREMFHTVKAGGFQRIIGHRVGKRYSGHVKRHTDSI